MSCECRHRVEKQVERADCDDCLHRALHGQGHIPYYGSTAHHSASQDGKGVDDEIIVYSDFIRRRLFGLKAWRLVSFEALPEWMKDNPAIIHYYRPQLSSYRECLKSLFYFHNETGNIYTHLIGFFGAMIYSFYVMACLFTHDTWGEVLAFESFFMGACVMLFMSTAFHTLCVHSPSVCNKFCRCDYVGIAAMVAGSYSATIYFGFMCDKWTLLIYEVSLLLLVIACSFATFSDEFDRPHYRKYRTALFISLGVSGAIPVFHAVYRHGLAHADNTMAFSVAWMQWPIYLFGAALYAARVPERFFPGKLDLFFHSHQIHHVCVLFGAAIHFYCITTGLEYRRDYGCSYEDLGVLVLQRPMTESNGL